MPRAKLNKATDTDEDGNFLMLPEFIRHEGVDL